MLSHSLIFGPGIFTQDLAMFGNSWAEDEPERARCPVVSSLYPSPCATQSPFVISVQHLKHAHIGPTALCALRYTHNAPCK